MMRGVTVLSPLGDGDDATGSAVFVPGGGCTTRPVSDSPRKR